MTPSSANNANNTASAARNNGNNEVRNNDLDHQMNLVAAGEQPDEVQEEMQLEENLGDLAAPNTAGFPEPFSFPYSGAPRGYGRVEYPRPGPYQEMSLYSLHFYGLRGNDNREDPRQAPQRGDPTDVLRAAIAGALALVGDDDF